MPRRQFITGGLALAAAASFSPLTQARNPQFTIIGLVFDDYETLDLHGPVEMLGHVPNASIKLAGKRQLARSYQGPSVLCDLDLTRTYPCDLFLIPGGLATRTLVNDPELIDWITRQAAVSKRVFSVCTGAALLAKTGLLDGHKATGNKMAFDWIRSVGPNVEWIGKARWQESGKYLTASGVSAGTDAALQLIETVHGKDVADRIQTLAEYDRNRDPGNDPYAVEA
ncbi:DJ-1/PfpI family protein [Marinobacter hydrocarbonoclasticus]|nr:DJ-1/PfpI family protein [Marinobacter nauticus]